MITTDEITRELNTYFPALELAVKRINNIVAEGTTMDPRYIEELSAANDDATAAAECLNLINRYEDRDQLTKAVQREFNYLFSRENRNIRAAKIYNAMLLALTLDD